METCCVFIRGLPATQLRPTARTVYTVVWRVAVATDEIAGWHSERNNVAFEIVHPYLLCVLRSRCFGKTVVMHIVTHTSAS